MDKQRDIAILMDIVALGEIFPSISFHCGFPYSYITWGINNRPIGDRSSEI
jgi:hypothetical protein